MILICAIIAILFGLYNVYRVLKVKVNEHGVTITDIEMQPSSAAKSEGDIEAQMMEVARLI